MRRGPHLFIVLVLASCAAILATVVMATLALPRLLILRKRGSSDCIVVLYGHDENYQAGLRLLRSGIGKKMFVCLDLPDVSLQGEELRLDREFLRENAGPLADKIDLCGSEDEEIFAELGRVLDKDHARRVLLVTPEPQSRAQYIIATRRLPQFSWAVMPVSDQSFDIHWWRKRVWTKTYLNSICDFLLALEERPSPEISAQVSSK